jgi:hypothetical protein
MRVRSISQGSFSDMVTRTPRTSITLEEGAPPIVQSVSLASVQVEAIDREEDTTHVSSAVRSKNLIIYFHGGGFIAQTGTISAFVCSKQFQSVFSHDSPTRVGERLQWHTNSVCGLPACPRGKLIQSAYFEIVVSISCCS